MCGILGSISNRFHFSEEDIKILAHRGPDDQGYFYEEGIMLGHRRLSIVDLSSHGHQPMFTRDGRYCIVYNGEIYNHADLRKDLVQKGYKFFSTSDTETLLYGFAEYGISVVERLNGIFAFAVYDRTRKEVFIARDQMGVKPLYYYHKDGVFAFASEIKAFLSIPGFDKSINTTALFYYLQLLYSPGEGTPFTEVKKLLPGHYMTVNLSQDRYEIKQYFEVNFSIESNTRNEQQWIELLDKQLYKAVERQLMSDVPLGFFLSGGLDSSLVVALAAKILPSQKLTCFTISSGEAMKREGFSDDEQYARKVAAFLSVDLDVIPGNLDILRRFDQMIWQLDEPQADPAPLHVYTICEGARQKGIKVLLGGTAGDDLFSGYRRHQAINLEKYFKFIPRSVSNLVESGFGSFRETNPTMRRIKKVAREMNKTKLERFAGYFTWLPQQQVMNLFAEEVRGNLIAQVLPNEYYDRLLAGLPEFTDDLNRLLFLELKTFLPDHNLNYTDKMSMANGVEARVPYLDAELVELAGKIPVHLKMKGNTTKYLLRKVAEKYLPHEVIYRPKTGFGAPVRSWIRNEMKEMIAERLSEQRLSKRGIFDVGAVKKLIKDNEAGTIDASYTIWSLLAIESWMEQFVDNHNY